MYEGEELWPKRGQVVAIVKDNVVRSNRGSFVLYEKWKFCSRLPMCNSEYEDVDFIIDNKSSYDDHLH